MNNNDLIPLLKDKVKMFEKSEAFKSGCSFSDYLYDYYSEHGYNIPSGYTEMDLAEACYALADLVGLE